jgi:hypothetical protein
MKKIQLEEDEIREIKSQLNSKEETIRYLETQIN